MRKVRFGLAFLSIAMLVLFAVLAARPADAAPTVNGKGVRIVNFAFQPGSVTIPVGWSIGWKNTTTATQHTTTSDNALWDSGVLNPGQHFIFKFTTPGTYTYHCSIHTFMKGTIIVQ